MALTDTRNRPVTRRGKTTGDMRAPSNSLVEGKRRISTTIQVLPQHNWSNAALCVGHEALAATGAPSDHCVIEPNLSGGARSNGAAFREGDHIGICRPI